MVGSMPLFVAVVSACIEGERFGPIRIVGSLAVVVGIVLFILQPDARMGFALFLTAGALWAGYTLAFRLAGIGPWHAAAIINFGSFIAVAPILSASLVPACGSDAFATIC
jgi:drug/metabolite transporter (DMT)-like permease